MVSENKIPECIERYEKMLNNKSFYVGKSIPEKKAKNAIKAYGDKGIGSVYALFDGTIFGSAKEGLLLTERSVFYHYLGGKWSVNYEDIHHLEIKPNNFDQPDPFADMLSIYTGADEYRLDIASLNKRYLLAMLEDICGIENDGDRKRFDIDAYLNSELQDIAASMDSTYLQKRRCIYCNSRITERDGQMICTSCGRVNQPMAPVSALQFEKIQEEYLSLLREQALGAYGTGSQKAVLDAAEEGKLKIAAAVSDGYYSADLRYDSDTTENDQFVRTPDGIPIRGRFSYYRLQEEGSPVWIVRLQESEGKKRYAFLAKDKYDKLAEALTEIGYALYPVDDYEPEKRSEGQ